MYLYITQRTEARFKVFSRSKQTIFNTFEYDNIDFNVGGTYDTTTYEYTFENAGTYLMGYSYSKKSTGFYRFFKRTIDKRRHYLYHK